jgi:hypothetical protein
VDADQIEEGCHGQSFTQLKRTHHRNFGQLVKQENDERNAQPKPNSRA